MDRETVDPLKSRDTTTDLKAAVEARRELGPEMEEHLLAAFLGRIEQQVDARVKEQLARRSGSHPVDQRGAGGGTMIAIASSTFALAIPLLTVAAIFAGAGGVWAVMIAVVIVNLLYLIDRWR